MSCWADSQYGAVSFVNGIVVHGGSSSFGVGNCAMSSEKQWVVNLPDDPIDAVLEHGSYRSGGPTMFGLGLVVSAEFIDIARCGHRNLLYELRRQRTEHE